MSEYTFKGFVKDLHQKHKGDKYLKQPHTVISFAMIPMMNQKIFEQIIKDIVMKSQFASIGIQTKERK